MADRARPRYRVSLRVRRAAAALFGLAAVLAVVLAILSTGEPRATAAHAPVERRANHPLVGTGPPPPSPLVAAPCFGAASRNPDSRCANSALRLAVHPAPATAAQEPNALCVPVGQTRVLLPCEFGVPEAKARATFALIGDSHASHWRAALDGVARKKQWRGVSLTRTSCPFTRSAAALEGEAARKCVAWNDAVLAWLRTHPQVRMIFVSEHSGGRILHPASVDTFAAQIAGYRQAWGTVPPSVQRIFVIRDTPRDTARSPACVERALRRRRPPGIACAVPRAAFLKPDPAAVAARRADTPRVRLINLTRYMCSARVCQPVIGGALVHKDVDHLTQTFSATLAPFLQKRIDTVLREDPILPGS